MLVTSKVLNEGVDVPEAKVAVVLSGTGSSREYVQRLGRILRRREGKLALLYEVVAEDTSEEGVSRRRRERPGASTVTDTKHSAQRTLFAPIGEGEALGLDEL